MNKTKTDGSFDSNFWLSFDKLGIYSKEDGPLLADQDDAPVTGGKTSSDSDENTNESNEQSNDNSLGDSNLSDNGELDTDSSLDGGDTSGDMNSSDGGSEVETTSDGGTSEEESTDPNENPFKAKNGKSLLDAKLAELQAAITDTLQRIYANPKLDAVVVSELENLADSVRNIRETIFMIPIENSVYKYKLAVTSYASLSKEIVTDVIKKDQDN